MVIIITENNLVGFNLFDCRSDDGATSFQIPANAYVMSVEAVGASGVMAPGVTFEDNGGMGGLGGIVDATLSVSPSTSLVAWAGCQDQAGIVDPPAAPGGFGGSGGRGVSTGGGVGGGGTGISPYSTSAVPPFLLIAGGGGGAAHNSAGIPQGGGNGGNGGPLSGNTAGYEGAGIFGGGDGGVEAGNAPSSAGGNGTDGSNSPFGLNPSGGGGGGGGGYYGGGLGHGSNSEDGGGGGGAGGISFVTPNDALSSSFSTATAPGNGSLIIKYYPKIPAKITSLPPTNPVLGTP